jgi:hypothetical protein
MYNVQHNTFLIKARNEYITLNPYNSAQIVYFHPRLASVRPVSDRNK